MDITDLLEPEHATAEWCDTIVELSTSSLFTDDLFTKQEATSLSSAVMNAAELATELKSLPLELVPEVKLLELRDSAKSVVMSLRDIENRLKALNEAGLDKVQVLEDWRTEREAYLADLRDNIAAFVSSALTVIPFLSLKTTNIQSRNQVAESLITQLKEKSSTALKEFSDKEAELNRIITVARDTAAQAGIAQHSQTFSQIAGGHARASKQWLAAAGVLLVITVIAAYLFLFYAPAIGDFRDAATIQRIVAKVVAVSILYYAAVWSAKNYRTHRHLAVLNAHRQSALQTFDAFIKASSGDEQTKNAVLLEATRCIFAPANTGYLGASEDDSQSNRIIEIFKTVGSSSSK